ncbi:MAG: gamma-glutamyl-phosphate reductase, partial [Gammaproteobacteria bacterium]|nr:gamma-glutamyl-phosphate reductase [Gammaproteobacteria bacterium]
MTDATATETAGNAALATLMQRLGAAARAVQPVLARATCAQKDHALITAAAALRRSLPSLLAANARDMQAAEARDLSAAMLD